MSLSVDHTTTYDCNFFMSMRALHTVNLHRFGNKNKTTMKRLVQLATIDGARDLGFADKVGSLTPGKRADLILIRTTDSNLSPVGDPYNALVQLAQPSNVDTVVVDGRILKRGGKLAALDTPKVIAAARAALAGVRERTNWR